MSAIKVLLLEDDRWQADLYESQLKHEGYRVLVVDSPHEAVLAIDDYSPDVVVADVLLKGNTVFPLIHEMASHEDVWSVPIILITTEASLLGQADLSQYGVVSVLDKATMGVDDIVASIRRVTHES